MKCRSIQHQSGFSLIECIVVLVIVGVIGALLYNYFGSSLIHSGDPVYRLQRASNLSKTMENMVADYNNLNLINLRYVWKTQTAYKVSAYVVPTTNNGYYYKCTSAGTSGSSEPSWPTTNTATVADGTVMWKNIGKVRKSATPYTAGEILIPYYNNGHYYRCATTGTSSTSEPSWPTTNAATVTDGTVTWVEAGTILESSYVMPNLKNYLDSNASRYGVGYTVFTAETKFIQFSGTAEVDAGSSATSSEKNNLKVTIKDDLTGITLTTIFTIR